MKTPYEEMEAEAQRLSKVVCDQIILWDRRRNRMFAFVGLAFAATIIFVLGYYIGKLIW